LKGAREKYRQLCLSESSIPLFSQAWWLDAVAGESWDVVLCEKDGKILASMPFIVKKKLFFSMLTMPVLTQHLGPWFRVESDNSSKRLASEKDLMAALISQLPDYDYFSANWQYSRTNWLPFYWAGFKQTTRYTYVLDNLLDQDALWGQLQQNIRGDIRKAEGRFSLKVRDDLSLEDFLTLNNLVFKRQGMQMPYSAELVERIDKACAAHNSRKILIAEDSQGRHHAGVYIVWDEHSAYYLMGGGDPELRSSGATSLCMWEAIKFSAGVARRFDFEGSMLEPVERFIRGFGAVQAPYFSITKTPSKLLKLHFFLQDLRSKG
jgi:hypothetical protein